MGWCSGTIIFDALCDSLLSNKEVDKKKVLKDIINILWREDWDCETESNHINNEMVRECFFELDGEWKEHFVELDEWEKGL